MSRLALQAFPDPKHFSIPDSLLALHCVCLVHNSAECLSSSAALQYHWLVELSAATFVDKAGAVA